MGRLERLIYATWFVGVLVTGPAGTAGAAPPEDVVIFDGMLEIPPGSPIGIGPDSSWSLRSLDDACVTTLRGSCRIDASGVLTHAVHGRAHPLPNGSVPHIDVAGPSCFVSQGDGGLGVLDVDGSAAFPGTSYNLSNVGWIMSAGGNIPISGDISGPLTNSGLFVGLIQGQVRTDLSCELLVHGVIYLVMLL